MTVEKWQVDNAKKEAGDAYQTYSLLKEQFTKAEKEYFEKSQLFQKLDYQLALTDGRMTKVTSAKATQKVQKQPALTLEQLKTIAEKLGFSLTEVEKLAKAEEVDEETIEMIMKEGESHETEV
jgi:hypothetical protein